MDDLEHFERVPTDIDATLNKLRELGIWVSAPAGNHKFTNLSSCSIVVPSPVRSQPRRVDVHNVPSLLFVDIEAEGRVQLGNLKVILATVKLLFFVFVPDAESPLLLCSRAGCWNYNPLGCRSAFRDRSLPGDRGGSYGLRVCFFDE